ncbi:L-threonine 3-dehydrogenase [Prolixibacteraceae bacterium]|nr:L-threonine 3-dehydrogenase [Prolixibacteraceae bacterium]
MKAIVKAKAEKGLWLQEVPMPKVGVNDVLIKIKKSAICGTDLHIYKWDAWAQKTIKTPMTIGHEYVGEIVELGSEVNSFKIGERVTAEGHIACGFCRNCRRGRKHICDNTVGIGVNRDGGFAEYVAVPVDNVMQIDERIPDEIVSIMDPLGNATHTALSFPLVGEDVIVTGAGGPIGAMAIAVARFCGANNILGSETSEYRMKLAETLGATKVINPLKSSIREAMTSMHMVSGFDIGLECSGSPYAFKDMLGHMYNGGKISLLGLLPESTQVEWDRLIFKGLTLKGIYGREMYETWYHMEKMLLTGLDVSPVITHRMHYTDFQKGFDIMEEGNCGKIILDWTE